MKNLDLRRSNALEFTTFLRESPNPYFFLMGFLLPRPYLFIYSILSAVLSLRTWLRTKQREAPTSRVLQVLIEETILKMKKIMKYVK